MTEQTSQSQTKPLWSDTTVIPKQPIQTGLVTVDVCIVGAGITGLTAAALLKQAGKTVAVIDLARIGAGETSHTTAHLTEVFDLDYSELISNFGVEGAQLAAQSVRRSIDRVEENIRLFGIDCDFTRLPGYRYTDSRSGFDEIEDEAACALRAGVPNELVFDVPLPFKTERAIRFDHQAQFNPMKYLKEIGRAHV